MTELEQRVESCKCSVELAELELREKELEVTHGCRFLDEAKEKYGKLKIAVDVAKVKLRDAKAWLQKVEADKAKGFEQI